MQKIEELKQKLADAKAALTALDGNITVMKTRQALITEKIASVAAELSGAETAATTAAKNFAVGRGDDDNLIATQTAVARLTVKRDAFQAALEAITAELTAFDEPRKAAAGRVEHLGNLLFSAICDSELKKANIFIQRAHTAFHKNKHSYMNKSYFEKEVANLVHRCRHDNSDKISKELSTIYELNL